MHMELTSLMSMGRWTFGVHKGWRNHTIEQGGCISRTHDMEGELVQKDYAQTTYMKCLIGSTARLLEGCLLGNEPSSQR